MVVMAINSAEETKKHVEFTGKKDKRNSRHTSEPTNSNAGAKAVPVMVLLAMSPMNATPQQLQMLEELNNKNTVELYTNLPETEAPNALEIAQVPQKPTYNPPPRKADGTLLAPYISKDGFYVNSESFIGLDGKNYYIYYNNLNYEGNKPNSSKYSINCIYIVPENYKPAFNVKVNYPPRIYGFVNHNNEFASVALIETGRGAGTIFKEMILPDDITEKLLDIANNENPAYEFDGTNDNNISGYCTTSTKLRYYEYTYRDLCE